MALSRHGVRGVLGCLLPVPCLISRANPGLACPGVRTPLAHPPPCGDRPIGGVKCLTGTLGGKGLLFEEVRHETERDG